MRSWLDGLLGLEKDLSGGATTTSGEAVKEGVDRDNIMDASSRRESVPPTQNTDDSEVMGEPVDYAQRLEEERRRHPVRPQKPNEGDRLGELVWRGGKWHTATDVVEAPKADRTAVMEKYKHPQKEDLPVPVLAESDVPQATPSLAGKTEDEARESNGTEGDSGGGQSSSRDDLVKEAVAVLKQLCTSPYATGQVRKELKKQKVTK